MNRLRKIREANFLTQQDVGNKLGCSEMSISRYERDERRLRMTTVRKLAVLYGVTVGQLLGEEPWPAPRKAADGVNCDALETVMTTVDGYLRTLDHTIPNSERAKLCASLYDITVRHSDSNHSRHISRGNHAR